MDYFFSEWKNALEDFKSSVSKELEEIRLHKAEVQKMKEEIFSALNSGYVLHDDKRIVLSAPEIVIGNVDKDGILKADQYSHVILRAHHIDLEGVGEGGSVQTKAASIRQTAADPGIDGQEAVVGAVSEVISQARNIVLEGDDAEGMFVQEAYSTGAGGVRIHADNALLLEAAQSTEKKKSTLEALLKEQDNLKSGLEKEVAAGIKSYENLAKSIQDIIDGNARKYEDEFSIRTQFEDIDRLEDIMQVMAPSLYESYVSCAQSISRLAEVNRQIACLKKEKQALKDASAFKKETTGATVSIAGEIVDITSSDGDGNLRDNKEAGVSILANDIKIKAVDGVDALQKEGKILMRGKTLEFSTQDSKDLKFDKGELQSGTYPAEGDFVVKSKNISFEALDEEFKDKKLQEKALTKEGSFKLRAESVDVSATDTEGKATGSISLNSKEVSVRSMDVEKEKRTDDKLAAGSTMLLLSEKMFLGAKKKDVKSKKVQVFTEEAGLFADKTLELQQGEAKAVLQLADGKAALSGSETQLYGKTTLNAKTEVKDELKAPKATIDHVEAKSSFKSSNISDGIPVPPPPSTAKLSAKLKAEDTPEKK